MLVLTDVPGFGESRSTWNIKNIKPNNAGPRPLHKPRMPVIIPWTAPTVDNSLVGNLDFPDQWNYRSRCLA